MPEDLIVNQQTRNVNDTLRFLPSVEIRDQQGFEVSRPQSRGFQSSIVQNTRLDGLNVIGTTAIPAENLAGIEVLNGPGGALFGPETPAGTFDYILKRPTDTLLLARYIEGFDSSGVFTEQADISDRGGPGDRIGARLNVLHGQGESYVEGSSVNRTLASLNLDFHLDDRTVIEADYSHYETEAYGLPGSFVYDGASTTGKGQFAVAQGGRRHPYRLRPTRRRHRPSHRNRRRQDQAQLQRRLELRARRSLPERHPRPVRHHQHLDRQHAAISPSPRTSPPCRSSPSAATAPI